MSEKNEKLYTAEQNEFSVGLVSTKDPSKIDLAAVQECVNAFPSRYGRIKRRPGYEIIVTGQFSDGRAIRRFTSEDGTQSGIVAFVGKDIVFIQDNGTWRYLARMWNYTAAEGSPGIAHEEWDDAIWFSTGVTGDGLSVVKQAAAAQSAVFDSLPDPTVFYLTGSVDTAGAAGNDYTLALIDPEAPSEALDVVVTGTDIVVSLETDASGNCISTPDEVELALAADATVGTGTITWAGGGTGLATPFAEEPFYGGADIGDLYVDTVMNDYTFTYLAARTASERLFGIDADDPGNVRWCDAFAAATWGALSVISPGGKFIAAQELDRVMVLHQADRILRIDGTDPSTWEVVPVGSEGLGCIAPQSVIEVEGVGVYFSPRGLAYFNGTKPAPLSDNVYNVADPDTSVLPLDSGLYEGMFTVQAQELVYVFFKSASTNDGCDRVMVLDFRTGAWGGPYELGFEAVAGCMDLTVTGDSGALTLLTADGDVLRENIDVLDDAGVDFTMKVGFKTIDADRSTLDKVFRGVRVGYKVSGACTLTVNVYCEDESTTRTNCTKAFAFAAASNGVLTMALPAGTRARSAWVEVVCADAVDVELSSEAVDLFFVLTR